MYNGQRTFQIPFTGVEFSKCSDFIENGLKLYSLAHWAMKIIICHYMKSSYSNCRHLKGQLYVITIWMHRLMFDLKKLIDANIVDMENYSFMTNFIPPLKLVQQIGEIAWHKSQDSLLYEHLIYFLVYIQIESIHRKNK